MDWQQAGGAWGSRAVDWALSHGALRPAGERHTVRRTGRGSRSSTA